MAKKGKSDTIRAIPGGRQIELSYSHPLDYYKWKSAVSYCNTAHGSDDGKIYSLEKDTVNKSLTISAKWIKHENVGS